MEKYSEKLINDYILGEEIDNLDELEDDPFFMMQVIDKSDDYRLYNLCSENVKKNYEFVKHMVLKFSFNPSFITKVADYYLARVKDEFSTTELVAILLNIPMDMDCNMRYRMMAHSLYYFKRMQVEACKKTDEYFEYELGMGYLLVFEQFKESPIILDFYAKKMIDGIFEEYNIHLDTRLHEDFSCPEELYRLGINNYLLRFIGDYDSMLANYLSVNLDLLDDLKKVVNLELKRWNKYVDNTEREKYILMFDLVHEYIETVGRDMLLDETTILYYLGNKLGINDKIHQYDLLFCQDSLDDIFDSGVLKYINEVLEHNFAERRHLINIEKIMCEVLGLKKENKKSKCKIIDVDFKNKNRLS